MANILIYCPQWDTLVPALPLTWSSEAVSLCNSNTDSPCADILSLLSPCQHRCSDGELRPSVISDISRSCPLCSRGTGVRGPPSGIWGRYGMEEEWSPQYERSRVSFYKCAIWFMGISSWFHVSLLLSLLIQSHQDCHSSWLPWMKRGFWISG